MSVGAAFGAAAASDALRQILLDRFNQQQEQQRTAIAQQRANDIGALERAQAESMAADRQAQAELHHQQAVASVAGMHAPGDTLPDDSPDTQMLQGAGLVKINPQPADAAFLDQGGTPDYAPGEQPGNVFLGTGKQRQDQGEQDRFTAAKSDAMNSPDTPQSLRGYLRMLGPGEKPDVRAFLPEKPTNGEPVEKIIGPNGKPVYVKRSDAIGKTPYEKPTQESTVVVQTVDDQGNPVTKIVPKKAGSTFTKPPSATTQTRLDSAQAVQQTGNDIIAQLSDPKVAATLGPAMGRYSSLRDFIGNPPPEFSELAGTIESYALANMGVHGMRSAQGAEQIKHLLDGHHTPQSLAAAVKGLNKFSQHFMENKGVGGKTGATESKPTAEDLIKKYGGD